jgi:hypothetical protein
MGIPTMNTVIGGLLGTRSVVATGFGVSAMPLHVDRHLPPWGSSERFSEKPSDKFLGLIMMSH